MKKNMILSLFTAVLFLPALAQASYVVTSVLDGDTIEVNQKDKITLAGVDSPEVYHNRKLYKDAQKYGLELYEMMGVGKEAWIFTRGIVGGRKVRVEMDTDETNVRGDHLGYVFVKVCDNACNYDPSDGHEYVQLEDGVYDFVNATLVKSGYAAAQKGGSVKYRDLFKKLEREAQQSQSGLWVAETK